MVKRVEGGGGRGRGDQRVMVSKWVGATANSEGVRIGGLVDRKGCRKWMKVGSNLIAYGAGDGDMIKECFQTLQEKEKELHFEEIIRESMFLINNKNGRKRCWIQFRDRLLGVRGNNLLTAKFTGVGWTYTVGSAAVGAIGSGANEAEKVIKDYLKVFSADQLANNSEVRKTVACKALLEAMLYNKSCGEYCEVLRGDKKTPWHVAKIGMDSLMRNYGLPFQQFPSVFTMEEADNMILQAHPNLPPELLSHIV